MQKKYDRRLWPCSCWSLARGSISGLSDIKTSILHLCFSLSITHELRKTKAEPLPDVVLDNIPHYAWALGMQPGHCTMFGQENYYIPHCAWALGMKPGHCTMFGQENYYISHYAWALGMQPGHCHVLFRKLLYSKPCWGSKYIQLRSGSRISAQFVIKFE